MKLKIAKLPGDGIGPEVVEEAVKAVNAVCRRFGHEVSYTTGLVGACAIDRCGNPYPAETHARCMESDAVLFAAVGDPRYDNDPVAKVRPEQGLLAMRKRLGLYASRFFMRCCSVAFTSDAEPSALVIAKTADTL